MIVRFPAPGMALVIGIAGSGKSSFIKYLIDQGQIEADEVISGDKMREILTGDASIVTPEVNKKAFALVHEYMEQRLGSGQRVVVDATNIFPVFRKEMLDIADRYNAFKLALVLNYPLELCLKNNAERGRQVPEEVILKQFSIMQESLPTLAEEGLNQIQLLSNYADAMAVELVADVAVPAGS